MTFVAASDRTAGQTDTLAGPGEGGPRAGDARAPAQDRSVHVPSSITHGDRVSWWSRRPVAPAESWAQMVAVGPPVKGAGVLAFVGWLIRASFRLGSFLVQAGAAAVSGLVGVPGGLVLVLVCTAMLWGAFAIGGAP